MANPQAGKGRKYHKTKTDRKGRKLPVAGEATLDTGEFDLDKFKQMIPDARAAFESGEAAIDAIVFKNKGDGTMKISVERRHGQHAKREPGIDVCLAMDMMDWFVGKLAANEFEVVGGDEEEPNSKKGDGHDVWSFTVKKLK